MKDHEEIVSAFKQCGLPGACLKCKYGAEREGCYAALRHDVLELLKKQPEQKFFVDIKHAPTIGGWISVEDKLPGIDEDVLILYESKVSPRKTGYAITCLKDSFYFGSTPIPYSKPQWSEPWQYFRENNVITHWMPLPEPPKEEKQNET